MAETYMATTSPALRFRCMAEVVKLLNREFSSTAVPADLGTKRDRLIKRLTGNDDPYKRSKQQSNETAAKLLPNAKKFVESSNSQLERFKKACLCAIVGNTMEFDSTGHTFTCASLRKSFREAAKDLFIDNVDEAYDLAKKAHSILFLSDNAGEIVFDTLLVEQLKNMGLTVTYVVKGGPVLNDATLEDVDSSGMRQLADNVLTTGADAVGLLKKEVSPEFMKA